MHTIFQYNVIRRRKKKHFHVLNQIFMSRKYVYFTGKVDKQLESKLVVQALRINTLSKLTFSDCARFNALVKDVFPGIEFKDIEFDKLAEAIRIVCKEKNLKINETQVCLDHVTVTCKKQFACILTTSIHFYLAFNKSASSKRLL